MKTIVLFLIERTSENEPITPKEVSNLTGLDVYKSTKLLMIWENIDAENRVKMNDKDLLMLFFKDKKAA